MTSADSLEAAFKKVSKFALILFGLGLILIVVDIYVIAGYAFSQVASAPYSPFFRVTGEAASLIALLVAGFSCMLVSGIIVTRIGIGVGKGVVSNRQVLFAILSFSVFIIFLGTSSLLIPYITGTSLWLTNIGSLAIVSGVLLFTAPILYSRKSEVGKVIGSIMGIVAIGLLMAGGWQAQSGILGLATSSFPSVAAAGTVGSAGYIVAGVAALIYTFINNTRFSRIAHLIAMVGFILFGIEMAITTLRFVSEPAIWRIPGEALALMSVVIVAVIILAVSGFLIMASGGIGIGVYSRKLMSTAAVSEKADAQTMHCPQCGAKSEADTAFCKNCGRKLKQ